MQTSETPRLLKSWDKHELRDQEDLKDSLDVEIEYLNYTMMIEA